MDQRTARLPCGRKAAGLHTSIIRTSSSSARPPPSGCSGASRRRAVCLGAPAGCWNSGRCAPLAWPSAALRFCQQIEHCCHSSRPKPWGSLGGPKSPERRESTPGCAPSLSGRGGSTARAGPLRQQSGSWSKCLPSAGSLPRDRADLPSAFRPGTSPQQKAARKWAPSCSTCLRSESDEITGIRGGGVRDRPHHVRHHAR